jgi:hypothetical protein
MPRKTTTESDAQRAARTQRINDQIDEFLAEERQHSANRKPR